MAGSVWVFAASSWHVQLDQRGSRLGALIDHVNATVDRDALALGLADLKSPPNWRIRRATSQPPNVNRYFTYEACVGHSS
ncbi:hypothetical protein SAMN05443377_12420 [Propionibacterium cyclohexanicum]|uniref:Uncharacterized protein n=1 Tax=Propionibacterium cyclohexanicum TaxID=64702 RepID=A0A1H9TKH4_9ACTN|nr:hypothetical protein SAMN05443377_12420 [Propionibacterium cyclohexanicum]